MTRSAAFVLLVSCVSFAAAGSDFPQTGSGNKSDFSGSDFQPTGPTAAQAAAWESMNNTNTAPASESEPKESDADRRRSKARAKNDRAGGDGQAGSDARGEERGEGVSDADAENAPDDGSDGGMSLRDAQVNFETVVEAYVAKKSGGGYWPYRAKRGDKARLLKFVSIDRESVKSEGGGVYAGAAAMRDASGRRTTLEFKVDFSGPNWKVVSVKPRPAKAGRTAR